MQLLKSLVLSILASVIATWLLRRALQVTQSTDGDPSRSRGAGAVTVVVVPVLVGNSGNKVSLFEKHAAPFSFHSKKKRK